MSNKDTEIKYPIEGGCLCRRIRFQINKPPIEAGYCHCGLCKKSTGSIFAVSVFFPIDAIIYDDSLVTWYKSSETAKRGFCNQCGSPVFYLELPNSERISINAGCLDNPEQIQPQYHYAVESQVSWLSIDDKLPRLRCDNTDS